MRRESSTVKHLDYTLSLSVKHLDYTLSLSVKHLDYTLSPIPPIPYPMESFSLRPCPASS